jgi:hypothetical protein
LSAQSASGHDRLMLGKPILTCSQRALLALAASISALWRFKRFIAIC